MPPNSTYEWNFINSSHIYHFPWFLTIIYSVVSCCCDLVILILYLQYDFCHEYNPIPEQSLFPLSLCSIVDLNSSSDNPSLFASRLEHVC